MHGHRQEDVELMPGSPVYISSVAVPLVCRLVVPCMFEGSGSGLWHVADRDPKVR